MRHSNLFASAAIAAISSIILVSCSSTRYSNGFSYKSNDPGMNVGSSGYIVSNDDENLKKQDVTEVPGKVNSAEVEQYLEKNHVTLSDDEKSKLNTITEMVKEEYHRQDLNRQAGNQSTVATKDVIRNVAQEMQAKGMISEISEKKMQRIEKMSDRLDKKLYKEKERRSGFLGEGIDLFFAIMAIAGLAIALIFGTWIGILMLVVFGGIWLYRKLVTH